MFDPKIIAQIAKQSKAEKWPYPKKFEALKKASVESYQVTLENFQIQYKSDSQDWLEPTPEDTPILIIAEAFDKEAVREAITHHVRQQTPYSEFLKDIAAAGVISYVVDMESRSVTYQGKNEKDFHVENVPSL